MSTLPLHIRKATAEDLEILLEFEQAIIKTERPFDPTLKEDPIHYYDLEKMLTDPGVEIVVAEMAAKIVASGYAEIKEAEPYLHHQIYAHLGFMYVLPEYRGKGINAMIVEKLKEFARSKNISEIRLEVYSKNEPAITAYERSGFEKHMIVMRMKIE